MIADKLLEDLSGRYAKPYTLAIHDLFVAAVDSNRPLAFAAREALAETMVETMGAAEVLGAKIALRSAAGASREAEKSAQFRRFCRRNRLHLYRELGAAGPELQRFASTQTVLPQVTLSEALDDLVERTPVALQRAAERTAQRIAELYTTERVAAFVRSAEKVVTQEAQRFITEAFRDGIDEGEAGRGLAMAVEDVREQSARWAEGYARMVFRTNVNTAVTAGRFRQAQDPDIKAVVPAFRFDSVGDSDTRDNHDAADGIVMSVDNPDWNRIAPPLGYNCRCQVSHVSIVELEDEGRLRDDGTVVQDSVPSGAFPDPGFRHGGRPDLFAA